MHTCCDDADGEERSGAGGWLLLGLAVLIAAVFCGALVFGMWPKKVEPALQPEQELKAGKVVLPSTAGATLLVSRENDDVQLFTHPADQKRDPSRMIFRPDPNGKEPDLIRKLPVDTKAKPSMEKLNK